MRRNKANDDLRERATKLGIFQWQLAKALGIAETTLTIWLREELAPDNERRKLIEKALDSFEKGS